MSEPPVIGPEKVLFFDTTLRDGEQSPGATLNTQEKLDIARQLARLGVDIIEAGFPAASPGDLDAVRQIAQTVGREMRVDKRGNPAEPPVICGLARANKSDIDAAWEAVKHAKHPRIHTFLATSPVHMEHKLRMTPEQVVERTSEMVAYAKSYCADVEFSPEDAGRSQPHFLYKVVGAAIAAGATTINIPDTVGYITPEEFGRLIYDIREHTPGAKDVIISVHCHDDLGLATANTMAGIQNGARQVEVTLNGIGERAGNTSLEEVAMALHVRQPVYELDSNIITHEIHRTSDMVSRYTGMVIQPNKAIVGANAFAHEAGIHQDGILKNNQTYEIMRPEDVGVSQTRLVMGKHSGRHALRARLAEMGYALDDEQLNQAFARFKDLADRKKVITDADLEALIADEFYQPLSVYSLDGLQVTCGTMGMPTATVRLKGPDGTIHTAATMGTGPVDATYKAINSIVNTPNKLLEFRIHAITEGIDALGEVTVRLQGEDNTNTDDSQPEYILNRVYGGHGADTDIIVASAKAYINALNKLIILQGDSEHQALESASQQAVPIS